MRIQVFHDWEEVVKIGKRQKDGSGTISDGLNNYVASILVQTSNGKIYGFKSQTELDHYTEGKLNPEDGVMDSIIIHQLSAGFNLCEDNGWYGIGYANMIDDDMFLIMTLYEDGADIKIKISPQLTATFISRSNPAPNCVSLPKH